MTAAICLYVGTSMAGIFKFFFYLKLKNTSFTKLGIRGKFLSGYLLLPSASQTFII